MPKQSAHMTLVNETNFALYTPFLPEAAAGTLEPRHVVTPLREILKRTYLRLGSIVAHDPVAKTVELRAKYGETETLPYDQLLLALGSVSRVLPVPGLAEHAVGLQEPGRRDLPAKPRGRDAGGSQRDRRPGTARRTAHLRLRRRWLRRPRGAGRAAGLRRRRDGELPARPPARDALGAGRGDRRGCCRRSTWSWPTTRCASCAAAASTSASRRRWRRSAPSHARLSNGETLPTKTVVWTAGVAPQPILKELNLPLDERGRVPVDEYLRVQGLDSVWAIGDCAAAPDPRGGTCPPTAQHAVRQGPVAARNIVAELGIGTAAGPSSTAAKPPSSTSAATRPWAGSASAPSAASPPGGWPAATT